jgi:hypothetical protein
LGNLRLAPDIASSSFAVDRLPTFIGDLFSGGASEPVSDLRRRSIFVAVPSNLLPILTVHLSPALPSADLRLSSVINFRLAFN